MALETIFPPFNFFGLPVCQTNWTQTYVLAAKNNQCTGMNSKQIMSEVKAMNTKNTEKACKKIK